MALKTFKPITSAQRGLVLVENSSLYKGKPLKKLTKGLNKSGGRNNYGHLTARRKGGGHKRKYRIIDFKSELLEYTWHPDRFMDWCLTNDEKETYLNQPYLKI